MALAMNLSYMDSGIFYIQGAAPPQKVRSPSRLTATLLSIACTSIPTVDDVAHKGRADPWVAGLCCSCGRCSYRYIGAGRSSGQIQVMLDILLKEMMSVAHGVSEMEVSRARNQLKASLLMNLESKSITAEDIGRWGSEFVPSTVSDKFSLLQELLFMLERPGTEQTVVPAGFT